MSMFSEFHYPSIRSEDSSGVLRVVDLANCPFDVVRAFTVAVTQQKSRGGHAHMRCNQLVICTMGSADLVVDDGVNRQIVKMSDSSKGVWIPAGVWAEQHYSGSCSAILVLCDRLYEEDDYIRDYSQYKGFITSTNS